MTLLRDHVAGSEPVSDKTTYQDVATSAAGSCQPVLYPGLHWRERFGAAAHLIHWSYLSYRGNP
jgi:hypothetical protein